MVKREARNSTPNPFSALVHCACLLPNNRITCEDVYPLFVFFLSCFASPFYHHTSILQEIPSITQYLSIGQSMPLIQDNQTLRVNFLHLGQINNSFLQLIQLYLSHDASFFLAALLSQHPNFPYSLNFYKAMIPTIVLGIPIATLARVFKQSLTTGAFLDLVHYVQRKLTGILMMSVRFQPRELYATTT